MQIQFKIEFKNEGILKNENEILNRFKRKLKSNLKQDQKQKKLNFKRILTKRMKK